jgi:beta-mannosidase
MSIERIHLDQGWELAHFDGYGELINVRRLPPCLPNLVWIPATVPGSVYDDLMRAGWLPDVYSGCHTLDAQWVETQFWLYRMRFDVHMPIEGERLDLALDGLDLDANVFLNGNLIADHHNAFRPLRSDITRHVRARRNELIICLSSGLIEQADKIGGDYNLELSAVVSKRAHLRKPHFACRWDWSPRLINVGIGRPVTVERIEQARLSEVIITPELSEDQSLATLHVRAAVETCLPIEGTLRLECQIDNRPPEQVVAKAPPAGVFELKCDLAIQQPRLWWPRGYGEQAGYDVQVRLCVGREVLDEQSVRTAVRSVSIAQPPASDEGTLFHLLINGEPIFCKGANWVPADLLYARTGSADFKQLVDLAVEAEMNLLRIWGGGLYVDPRFLSVCDEAGVLVWHDLMFACSKFPGDDPAFVENVTREVRHQVRKLANHPSLVIWCGNNEIDMGTADGWIDSYQSGSKPCENLFHQRFADVLSEEDPSRPYWPSSPCSPDGAAPNDQLRGDQHPWNVSLGEAKGDYWAYRNDASRFANEGGMLGPSTFKTLYEILPESERRIGSRTWLHHDNTQNTWRGEPLLDDLLKVNLHHQPQDLSFESYIHYSSILHGEALETGIDNWRRRKFDSAAAVFWMFNDTWPATVSWTPIDYNRRRKAAFWYVKRAFAPQRAICVAEGDALVVHVVNDTREMLKASLRWGIFALAGGLPEDQTLEVTCPPNGRVEAARLPLNHWDLLGPTRHGAFSILSSGGRRLSIQRLFRARFKDLVWTPAKIQVERDKDRLRLLSDQFAWSVCLDTDGETAWPDNYMDLLPGIECVLPWKGEWPTPTPMIANPAWCAPGIPVASPPSASVPAQRR